MKGSLVGALLVVFVAVGGFVYTIGVGNEPLLGLDLQGGVSVVLQPADGAAEPSAEAMEQALEIIRNRVDGLGVAEPSISLQGDTIVVELPGVDQQQRALDLVGQTAELRFRPVLLDAQSMLTLGLITPEEAGIDLTVTTDTTEGTGETTDSTTADSEGGVDTFDPETGEIGTATTEVGTDTTVADGTDTTVAETTDTTVGPDEQGLAPIRRRQTTSTTQDGTDTTTAETTDTTVAETTDTTVAEGTDTTDTTVVDDTAAADAFGAISESCGGGLTAPEDDEPDVAVVLADADGAPYCLGPVVVYGTDDAGEPKYLTGAALETADVGFDGFTWRVNPTFRDGADGIDAFNYAAALCFGGASAECPFGQLAIVLDEVVMSAPSINSASFARDQIQISGSFDEDSAADLALALRYGALPVELQTQSVNNISASVGSDVLRSGIIAGIVGLTLVAVYLFFFYRLAGLVAIGGLVLSGLMLWTMIGWLGANQGLAISVSGIVGLIVSIGVSADSNIVYFENVKELVADGRRTTTAVERAYRSAISTIVKADVVSLIAAGLLYFLTVGAVKGFALYLGVATILDLIVSLFFMRPALAWLAEKFGADSRRFGMPGAVT